MKPKKFNGKLHFNKETVSNLNKVDMTRMRAGIASMDSDYPPCYTDLLDCTNNTECPTYYGTCWADTCLTNTWYTYCQQESCAPQGCW